MKENLEEQAKLTLGELLTVRTVPGREGKPIARMDDGRIVLFDQKSEFYDMLAPGQTVEGHVIVLTESYLIIAPTKKPEIGPNIAYVHYPEIDVDDIMDELEELIEKVDGNAAIIPKALLRVLKLQQLTLRILSDAA